METRAGNQQRKRCAAGWMQLELRSMLWGWLRRNPLIAYFRLAYGISWGGILTVLSAKGFDLAALQPLDTDGLSSADDMGLCDTNSLLLAVLMHAGYTDWLFVLFPATSFEQSLVWQTAFAAGLWVAVAVVLRRSAPRGRDSWR